jgi:signal transduction histidine kinase
VPATNLISRRAHGESVVATAYQVSVVLGLSSCLTVLLRHRLTQVWDPALLFWVFAVAIVDLFPVPWRGMQLSLSFPLLIAVAVLYAPPVAAAVALVGSLDPRELRRAIHPMKALFVRSEIAWAVFCGSAVFHLASSLRGPVIEQVLAVTVATSVDFAVSALLVAMYVRLTSGTPFRTTLARQGATEPQFILTYAALGIFSLVMAHMFEQLGGWTTVLFFGPLMLARQLFYRTKQLEEHLERERDSVAELRELNRLKSEFAAIASHELRTPLTTIIGYAKSMSRPEFSTNPALRAEIVEAMQRQGDRLLRLVENLLAASQFDAGQMTASMTHVPFDDLAREVIEALGDRTSRVRVRLGSDLPVLFTDRDLLGRVLQNLLDNALKYSPEDSTIELGARREVGSLVFWVKDQGIGIPKSQFESIFEPYHQVDSSSTRAHSGVGLGLGIVKRVLDHLGGEITVDSRVGAGSVFTVRLPAGRQHVANGPMEDRQAV